MSIYIYVCMYIYIHMYIPAKNLPYGRAFHIHTYTYTHSLTHIHIYKHIHIYTYTHRCFWGDIIDSSSAITWGKCSSLCGPQHRQSRCYCLLSTMVHSCSIEGCFSRTKIKTQKDQDSCNIDSNDIRFFSISKGLIHSISLYVC